MSEEINKQEEMNTSADFKWYVVHTYSGYENKVKANIEKTVANRGMQHLIKEVSVPLENVVEIKDGQKKDVQRKIFPGYVLLHMIMTDETWYIVRNTRGVTSFVGPGSKPVPLTDDEVYAMGIGREIEHIDVEVGDMVSIVGGPFAEFVGTIQEINTKKKEVVVMVSSFNGRETPVTLDFAQIRKM